MALLLPLGPATGNWFATDLNAHRALALEDTEGHSGEQLGGQAFLGSRLGWLLIPGQCHAMGLLSLGSDFLMWSKCLLLFGVSWGASEYTWKAFRPEESPQQTTRKTSIELPGRERTVAARKSNRVTQGKTGSERWHYSSRCEKRDLG